jgi:hypothetical protein
MDLLELVATAAPGALLGAIAGGLVAEVRGRRAEAREEERQARDRAREWDLKRIADTRGQLHLQVAATEAHHRGDAEREAELDRELGVRRFPDNDIRILGDRAQAVMTQLYRFSSFQGDELDVLHAARELEDLIWRVTGELRDRVEAGEPLRLVEISLEAFPDDVRRRFVSRDRTSIDHQMSPE